MLVVLSAVPVEAGEASDLHAGDPDARIVPVMRRHYKDAKAPPRLIPLRAGAVTPQGWLRDWAETSAQGIVSQLPDRHLVFRLGWTGEAFESKGSAGRGLRWPLEQSAYWLDGLVRLAHILDDPKLKQIAHTRLDQVVDGVNHGGETFIWWEPGKVLQVEGGDERFDRFTRTFNNWAHAHVGRALVAYYRATGEARILNALTRVYADYPLPDLPKDRFVPHGGATNLDPMLETFAMSGERRVLENALSFAETERFRQLAHQWATGPLLDGHTVLYYEHARVPAITYPWTGNPQALAASRRVLEDGLRHHGLPVGLCSGQEHLMGIGSIRGLETCTAPASAWTNKWMLQVTGECRYADQIERAILNAGAAAVSREFDTACYFQTMNRVDGVVPIHTLANVEGYDYSKTAGPTLCCVANATRMIPDYVQHMWMATLDGGLAATLYGPNRVRAVVGDGNVPVTIEARTNYPFDSDVVMTISSPQPVSFPLYVRIPSWCESPEAKLDEAPWSIAPGPDGFAKIERTWSGDVQLRLAFSARPRVERGETTAVPDIPYYKQPNRATAITKVKNWGQPYASVHYGPLLFALAIEDENPNRARAGARWQYALPVAAADPLVQVEVVHGEMPATFQWQLDAPLKLRVRAVPFEWKPSNAQPLPESLVTGGEEEVITLVPYGCTKFRISMFPVARGGT